jgi:hypothetical protein
MSNNGSRQVRERVELLKLTRARDRQQAFHGALTLLAACAEHDGPPLNGRAQGPLGGSVRRLHTLLVHEGEEMLIVNTSGPREVAIR